jgi:hypothetical protein
MRGIERLLFEIEQDSCSALLKRRSVGAQMPARSRRKRAPRVVPKPAKRGMRSSKKLAACYLPEGRSKRTDDSSRAKEVLQETTPNVSHKPREAGKRAYFPTMIRIPVSNWSKSKRIRAKVGFRANNMGVSRAERTGMSATKSSTELSTAQPSSGQRVRTHAMVKPRSAMMAATSAATAKIVRRAERVRLKTYWQRC